MNRAIEFYEKILGTNISYKAERMSSFYFDDYSLLLYNPEIDGEKIEFGNNICVNFVVDNIKEAEDLIKSKGCEIVMEIKRIEDSMVFQCKDLEGNIIEFFQEL
jgi:predicted enzyme related to lactoylglutathione lyase